MMTFTKYILMIAFLMSYTFSSAQQQFKAYVKAAQQAYVEENYYAALEYYSDAIDIDPEYTEVNYLYAESARNFNAYSTAAAAYDKVTKSDEAASFPLANYWAGIMKMQLGQYADAAASFQSYLDIADVSDKHYKMARNFIEKCKWSAEVTSEPEEAYKIRVLNEEINTPFSDFGAIERNDTIYYSSYRFENEEDEYTPNRQLSKILNSVKKSKGKRLNDNFNSEEKHAAHTAFNKSGNRIYFTRCDYVGATDIRCNIFYKEKKSNNSWSKAVKLPEIINVAQHTATQPNIGYDAELEKEVLYFVSDRPGGKGGKDIWYSVIDEEGNCGAVYNLEDINTAADDITPFYHEPSSTMYFSSQGYQGIGGFDIYRSAKNGKDWASVDHLDFPLNSSQNDIYFTLNKDGDRALFSSNRLGSQYIEKEKEACCYDIYETLISTSQLDLLALVYESENKATLEGATVSLSKLDSDDQAKEVSNEDTNDFNFKLDQTTEYQLIATKEGYTPDTLFINTADQKDKIESKLYLNKIPEKPEVFYLDALVFDATNKELSGVNIQLIEFDTEEETNQLNNKNNKFNFEVLPGKSYKLIATKEGYGENEIFISKADLIRGIYTKKIYLRKLGVAEISTIKTKPEIKTSTTIGAPPTIASLGAYLPLPLFFDNDQPDSRTRRISTEKTYGEAYNTYYRRKQFFKDEYASGLFGEQRIVAETEIENFFEDRVRSGYDNLEGFTSSLLNYLAAGNSVELRIKGYASPRAKSDYNKALTQRRISSIKNHFKKFAGGAFYEYLLSRQLIITEEPFGESQSSGVSDNLNDRKNSIYSVGASSERRIEIIEIRKN